MAAAAPNWALLPDDITRDIISRLRPNEPIYLFQVSHLCKDWLRALTDPDFRRLLHERLVMPLPLGFLHVPDDKSRPTFVRTLNWPFCLADVPERCNWKALDYRHGRALFLSTGKGSLKHGGFELLVWDPISGDRRRVPVPPEASRDHFPGAALVCAVPGCNHRPGCNGGHFQVAFIAIPPGVSEEVGVRGFIYSSEKESWSEVNSIPDVSEQFGERNSVLIGQAVYFLSDGLTVLEFDLAAGTLSVIPSPNIGESKYYTSQDSGRVILTVTCDGGLGSAEILDGVLRFQAWETTGGTWVQTDSLQACSPDRRLDLIGFAEGADTIFMRMSRRIFTYQLSSRQGRAVLGEAEDSFCIFPVVNFYATHNVLQGPDEKAVELAQRLFNRGSNSIEQMDFVNAVHSLRQSLDIRVGHYGKLAAECAATYYKYGCALLYKARSVTDCIGNVHKETTNDESVKSEYQLESNGTDVEEASLEKVNSDEGRKSNGKDQVHWMMAADQVGSDLELSWEMLDVARQIVEKSPNNTADMVHILKVLAEVTIERGKKESSSEHDVSSPV